MPPGAVHGFSTFGPYLRNQANGANGKEVEMMRWILGAILVAIIGLGIAGAIWGDGDWGPDRDGTVTRTVAADGTETIVVHEGRGGFFPFGFFVFPLGVLLTLLLVRAIVFRGPWGRGPWGGGGPGAGSAPSWFDEWHRRAHAQTAPPADAGTNG